MAVFKNHTKTTLFASSKTSIFKCWNPLKEWKHAKKTKNIDFRLPSVPTENICLAYGVRYWEHRLCPLREIKLTQSQLSHRLRDHSSFCKFKTMASSDYLPFSFDSEWLISNKNIWIAVKNSTLTFKQTQWISFLRITVNRLSKNCDPGVLLCNIL